MSEKEKDVSSKKNWYYQNGFNLSQCRKLCEFVFADFYMKVDRNEKAQEFHIFLFKERTIEDEETKEQIAVKLEQAHNIEYFKEFWCSNGLWKIHLMDEQLV